MEDLPRSYFKVCDAIVGLLAPSAPRPHSLSSMLVEMERANIKSLLDAGAGKGSFLQAIAAACSPRSVRLTAMDVSFDPYARWSMSSLGIETIESDIANLRDATDAARFDIVAAVGLFSMGSLILGSPVSGGGESNRVAALCRRHHEIVEICLAQLSDHPKASLIACAPATFLTLSPQYLQGRARIVQWEIEERKHDSKWARSRLDRYASAFSLSAEERRTHEEMWRVGADIAVLQALKPDAAPG